jgi:hypothetical protein
MRVTVFGLIPTVRACLDILKYILGPYTVRKNWTETTFQNDYSHRTGLCLCGAARVMQSYNVSSPEQVSLESFAGHKTHTQRGTRSLLRTTKRTIYELFGVGCRQHTIGTRRCWSPSIEPHVWYREPTSQQFFPRCSRRIQNTHPKESL